MTNILVMLLELTWLLTPIGDLNSAWDTLELDVISTTRHAQVIGIVSSPNNILPLSGACAQNIVQPPAPQAKFICIMHHEHGILKIEFGDDLNGTYRFAPDNPFNDHTFGTIIIQ